MCTKRECIVCNPPSIGDAADMLHTGKVRLCGEKFDFENPRIYCVNCRRYHSIDDVTLMLYLNDPSYLNAKAGLLLVALEGCLECEKEGSGCLSQVFVCAMPGISQQTVTA